MLLGLAIGGFFSLIWWLMLDPLSEEDFTSRLDIPPGTAASIAAGENAPFIPNRIKLRPGGSLVVSNRDSVEHSVGGFRIPPASEATISPATDDGRLLCTIHPSGSLGVGPVGRPSVMVLIMVAALVGLPLGLVCWLITMLGSRLDMGTSTSSVGSA